MDNPSAGRGEDWHLDKGPCSGDGPCSVTSALTELSFTSHSLTTA